jgi:sirohydrochlorin ferrochelatase
VSSSPDGIAGRSEPIDLSALQTKLGLPPDQLGLVLVDHGSRREVSNQLLVDVAVALRTATGLSIIEPAHMELAEPSIETAFRRAVEQGARLILVFPYFLAPGRHWQQDIPRLANEAAQHFPGIRHLVTAPLGLHPLMVQIIQQRITQCLARALGDPSTCDVCDQRSRCEIYRTGPD